ncbi:hypothetical protein FZC35_02535 [Candidatus Cytomitobacter indipagum]|uniref:Type IV / VI secretion system DotU domain-containing protein n=1 Tax=Candidatus Cytomitobacter indipagum TaxID=2601575 RepID=A0A5C0UEN6_9PROT|nr:DotU family type IV/VI secretion system protein [Candidatus Cytomitobacter indipagum]QEK38229.1 hypothetical protein FZC35_02535 [Candidatus Cytomitobacter indipagum]
MASNKIDQSFLMGCFQEFLNEVLKFKELILLNQNNYNSRDIQDILMRMIYYKRDLAAEEGTLIESGYKEISYIMTVFADETFINIEWKDKEAWKKNNLEMQIFGTHIGGTKLFDNISNFIHSNAVYKYDIGSSYLLCLGLNFRGKYRGLDDGGIIKDYKSQLFQLVNNYDPNIHNDNLFPQSQQHTIIKISNANMKSYQVWMMILGISLLSYISISYILWYQSTHEISNLISIVQKDIENVQNI